MKLNCLFQAEGERAARASAAVPCPAWRSWERCRHCWPGDRLGTAPGRGARARRLRRARGVDAPGAGGRGPARGADDGVGRAHV